LKEVFRLFVDILKLF